MTYNLNKLQDLGKRRTAALAELEAVRHAVLAELPAARQAGITWREIATATSYTETQLRNLYQAS